MDACNRYIYISLAVHLSLNTLASQPNKSGWISEKRELCYFIFIKGRSYSLIAMAYSTGIQYIQHSFIIFTSTTVAIAVAVSRPSQVIT